MLRRSALLALGAAVALVPAVDLVAQEHAGHDMDAEHPMDAAWVHDLASDVETVRDKLTGLAGAIPAETYDWRPGEGVRSVQEVFLHVAADNYLLAGAMGVAAPASTGVRADDYSTAVAYENREMTPAQAQEAMAASFDHLLGALEELASADMAEELSVFGQSFSRRSLMVLTTTHLHEHLGQMIAYARTNGVVPPWSM